MRRIAELLLFGLMLQGSTFAQSVKEIPKSETDTVHSEPVIFTVSSASEYIIDLLGKNNLWRPAGDTMKLSLTRLIHHANEPFDSIRSRLSGFDYDSVKFKHTYIVRKDTIPLQWLNDSTFIIYEVPLERKPLFLQKTVIKKVADSTAFLLKDRLPGFETLLDSMMMKEETIIEILIDTSFLESKGIQMYKIMDKQVIPSLMSPGTHRSVKFHSDSAKIIISDTVNVIVADRKSPFYIVSGTGITDSLQQAVKTLLSYTDKRDSVLLFINDVRGQKTPFWLTTGNKELYRYWVKNYKNDSITIWMGNPAKHDITLILEEDVNVNRLIKETADHIPITVVKPQKSLVKVEPLKGIPIYWNYVFSNTFGLNETYISNWAKGGESSLSGLIDIKGIAKYTNTDAKTQWTSSGRLKYGAIITEEYGYRTNNDMLEFNSQFNKVIKDKIDFSTVFYMKSQVAKGYNYPNDSVVVSKFLNPGTFTIGLGLEYKPGKKTQINFSMLSYKNTFVFDTLKIDQTRHGIPKDKRAKQEMGGQLVINNSISILEGLNMSNSVRLFSGYLDKPENIDVDWEINLEKRIKWYFKILLNFHMIYDDDIRFEVMDKNDKPVLLPDGSKKKSPKLQFKQFLGLTFTF
jgi:hypothetical protein